MTGAKPRGDCGGKAPSQLAQPQTQMSETIFDKTFYLGAGGQKSTGCLRMFLRVRSTRDSFCFSVAKTQGLPPFCCECVLQALNTARDLCIFPLSVIDNVGHGVVLILTQMTRFGGHLNHDDYVGHHEDDLKSISSLVGKAERRCNFRLAVNKRLLVLRAKPTTENPRLLHDSRVALTFAISSVCNANSPPPQVLSWGKEESSL